MRATTVLSLLAILFCAAASAAERTPIRFGIQTPQEETSYEDLVATWQAAEQMGYDSAWLFDHFVPILGDKDGRCLESWTTLAALATQTQRIRIGILVTGNSYRNPALLAKMATTVDHVSAGRLNLGIGAGWAEYEYKAYGFDFHTAKERADRLAEALEVITLLWKGGKPSYDGKYYHLFEAPFAPENVQKPHPPIVVGGKGKKWIMPSVARYADEWNVPIGVTPKGMRERLKIVRQECARIGRDPCVSRVSVFLPLVNITNIPLAGPVTRLGARLLTEKRIARSVLAGSAEDIQKKIQEYVDAGATEVIVNIRPPFDHDLMKRFATEVMPAFK